MHAVIEANKDEKPFYCRRCKQKVEKVLLEGFAAVCPHCRSIFHDVQNIGGEYNENR